MKVLPHTSCRFFFFGAAHLRDLCVEWCESFEPWDVHKPSDTLASAGVNRLPRTTLKVTDTSMPIDLFLLRRNFRIPQYGSARLGVDVLNI